jgi:RNA polymerase sigma factor (sigma-70 family)
MSVKLPPFQVLVDQHGADVRRFLVASVGPDRADDCFQETFLAALRAYPRLRSARNLRAWVLTIAHRKAIDAHRARSRGPVPVAEVPERPALPATGRATLDGEPELWAAVRELPPKQRSAVVHRYLLDLPYAEIGEALDTSEAAARRNVHEALKTLRGRWSE